MKSDVLVVGGGPAGIGAAIAAARMGADVTLIERYGYLGGMATGGYVLSMEGLPVGGIMFEIMERLTKMDGAVGNQVCPEYLKILADEMCLDAGVKLRFHTWARQLLLGGGIVSLISKSGRQLIEPDIVIDCTGDGDIVARVGAECETGTMAIGMNFLVAGIEPYPHDGIWQPEEYPATDAGLYWVNVTGVQNRNTGQWAIDLTGQLSAIDVDDLTYAEIENRRRIHNTFDYYKAIVPGWENARLVSMAPQLGVRESRHIIGLEMITNTKRPTVIAAAGTLKEDRFQIPYGALVPKGIDNMFVAGRCTSCHPHMVDNARLIPICVATGQAAGTAAAMCLQQDILPRELVVSELQEQLTKDGVMLE